MKSKNEDFAKDELFTTQRFPNGEKYMDSDSIWKKAPPFESFRNNFVVLVSHFIFEAALTPARAHFSIQRLKGTNQTFEILGYASYRTEVTIQ